MTTTIRIRALSLAIAFSISSPVWAQEEDSSPDSQSSRWRESTMARCMEQYSAEQCQDSEFLEENFHINSLEIAHRAAIRRNDMADTAMREVILQHACRDSPSKVCEGNQSAQCITEITQTCSKLISEAATCVQNAKNRCASTADPRGCSKQQTAQCPSRRKQPIEQLLAKYPKLSTSQKSHLITTAQTLDAKTRGWWSTLVQWTTTPFH